MINSLPGHTLQSRRQMDHACAPSRNTLEARNSELLREKKKPSCNKTWVLRWHVAVICSPKFSAKNIIYSSFGTSAKPTCVIAQSQIVRQNWAMLLKETLTLEKHGCLLQNLVIINFDGPHSILGIEDDGTWPTGLAWGGLPSTNQISRKDLKCAPGDMSRRDTKKDCTHVFKKKSTSKVTTIVVTKYLQILDIQISF